VKTSGARRRIAPRFLAGAALYAPLVLALSVAAVAPAAGEYRIVEIESLRISIDSDWGPLAAPGYLPVRFDITNLGDARVIEIIGQGSRWSRIGRSAVSGSTYATQSVRLARGARVQLTIPVPVFGESENITFEIREEGRRLDRFGFHGFRSRILAHEASVLIVADPDSEFGKLAARWPRISRGGSTAVRYVLTPGGAPGPPAPVAIGAATSGGGPTPRTTGPLADLVLDPTRLPTNWIGFSSLRAVVINPGAWDQLRDTQRSALIAWTAAGGDLVLVDGNVTHVLPGASHAAVTSDRRARNHLFGRVHLATSEGIVASGLSGMLTALDTQRDSNWALPANGASDWTGTWARGFRLPIPGIDGVPARTYLTILVLFTLLIGPVNYWWLRRHRRQVLLVLTAPLISAIFIVLLAAYAFAGEGFGVYGRAVSFTMLDQVRREASTRAGASLYAAGMTPSDGLRFGRESAVFPLGPEGAGTSGRIALDLNDAQRFSGGLLRARSPTNLETVHFRAARERVSFNRGPGGIEIVNGLDATILALVYRDGESKLLLSDPLPAGGQAVLKETGLQPRLLMPLDLPMSAKLGTIFETQPSGSYLAVLERSPFWDAGVARLVERGSFHLLLGWPEGQR
jgi:hypothetical protein